MSIFADNAQSYFEAGYNVLPLSGKAPIVHGWQEWGRKKQPQFIIDSWISAYKNHNIGLPLGEASGIIALDFDYDVDGLHKKIEAIAGYSGVKKKGAKGFTSFYYYNGERNRKWRKNDIGVVELLCCGNQTVLPPSVHPDADIPYIWITEDTLLDVDASELPVLPNDFCEKIDVLFGITKKIVSSFAEGDIDVSKIKNAMEYIPALQYTVWLEVGMALHHSLGGDGFDIWDRWSATEGNYNPDIMDKKWRSFGNYPSDKISASTIYHYAMQYGWFPSNAPSDYAPEGMVIHAKGKDKVDDKVLMHKNDEKTQEKHNFIKNQSSMQLPEHLLDAPNLVGMLAKWINDTSLRYQPNLALAASISAIGVVMAHRYRTETDLRSNIMTLGLSSSGSGKEHARKRIELLFSMTDMSDYIIGEFASDAAVISALHKRGGIGFSMTDEIGDSLAAMSSNRAAGYESRILKLTKELFSSASSVYRGKEYANHDGKQEAKILQQPCYCAYGTATHKQFYESMSSNKILDGFLSRWLVFCGDGYAKKDKGKKSHKPPVALIDAIKEIRTKKSNPMERSENGGLLMQQIRTTEVPMSAAAQGIFDELDNMVESLRINEFEKQSGLDAIYARVLEHAYKLALVAHNVASGEIDGMVAKWACEVAMTLAGNMIAIANEHIADGEYDKNYKAIFAYIESSGEAGRSKSDICRKFQKINLQEQQKTLHHLCESAMIQVIEENTKNNKKKQSFRAI